MKIKNLILASVFFFGITSCENQLDIEQPGEVNPSLVFVSVDNLQSALSSVYAIYPYTNMVDFVSVWTDEVKIGLTNGGQGIGDGTYSYIMNNESGDASSLWVSHNTLVNYANRVVLGSVTVPVSSTADQDAINDIVAQAKFMRALSYIQHLPFFTTDLSDDNALGLILFEDIPTTSDKRPRNTNGEIYSLIDSDLTYAEQNLAVRTGDEGMFYANVNACKAIRARMAIYRKQYTLAKTLSSELIASYTLSPISQFSQMWTDANNNERIFYIKKQVGNGTFAGIWSNVGPGIGKNNWYEFGRGLYEKYEIDDIRRTVYTGLSVPGISTVSSNPDTDTDYRVNDQICIYKYPGKNSSPYLADYKIFRVSEMYLINAEADIALANFNEAALTLKVLRDSRYGSVQAQPNYANAEAAYKDLLLERRRELCFEGHRYIDIKRLGSLANVTFDRYFRDCQINTSCSAPLSTDYRLTLPVPSTELQANPTIQQNPNY